jgi:hypothetical protein
MSTAQLSLDRAVQISEQAFVPFSTRIQVNREDASFSLEVLSSTGVCLVSLPHVARPQSLSPIHLAGLLEQLRLDLAKDGHALAPWSMPFVAEVNLQ